MSSGRIETAVLARAMRSILVSFAVCATSACVRFTGSPYDRAPVDGTELVDDSADVRTSEGDTGTEVEDVPDDVASANPCTGLVAEISAGDFHTCAQTGTGTMCCWGDNRRAQLGRPVENTSSEPHSSPVPVHPSLVSVHVSAGGQHTCTRTLDEVVQCWGENTYGQIAVSPPSEWIADPHSIDIPVGPTVYAGVHHSCAVSSSSQSSQAWCWGRNDDGQLGT